MSIHKKIDSIELIRQHPSMYIAVDDRPLYERLFNAIIYDMTSLDVYDISAIRKEHWIFIGSNEDWLKKGKFLGSSPKNLW